ncbi:MAG TPA: methyltransferase domain-containing protein [Acetobacteraceae bacterium]|nr:methyltransferase domain-containing protein [Acetobacteraceae bacterium]
MPEQKIRFEDGASYERMMGTWSRLAGSEFLDWLRPQPGLRWIDVGCGNGAFTELLIERCSPTEVQGLDPAGAQLAFARARPGARMAEFHQGDAMALPFPAKRFDAAVMALAIFYVPEPGTGVAEMARVVAPSGTVAAYVWDTTNGGSPVAPIQTRLREMGFATPAPPSLSASRMEALLDLWHGAGLHEIQTREIVVTRTFMDFDDFWTTTLTMPNISPVVAAMTPAHVRQLRATVQQHLPAGGDGRISYSARANAIMGRVAG